MLLEEYNFRREVLDAPGPVLVDFWAAWCGPCRAMTPTLHALARDFTVCKVNSETNPHLAAEFDVSAIPLLLIFQNGKVSGGTVVGTTVGVEWSRRATPVSCRTFYRTNRRDVA